MIETKKVEIEVTKEVHELGLAIKKVVESIITAKADGFQAGQDIPAILMASYQDLNNAIMGIDKVDDEVREMPVNAIMGALMPVAESVMMLLEKKEDEQK